MAKGTGYCGLVLDNDSLKLTLISVSGKKLHLVKASKFSLVSPLEKMSAESEKDVFSDLDHTLAENITFGLDIEAVLEDDLIDEKRSLDDDIPGSLSDNIDSELKEPSQKATLIDFDPMDETDVSASNEMLLHDILSSISQKKISLGLNIPAGAAIHQVLEDIDLSKVKKRDIKVIIDDRLESLYGSPKSEDFYSYEVQSDGTLLLSSINEEPQLLQLADRMRSLYKGKLTIEEILPDEILLMGLVKANYELQTRQITCVVQFSDLSCRVFFMKGPNLLLVSPVITEGTKSRKFLNTLFSKILFQLDTGEVPNMDRMIICNNSLGNSAASFFRERFPDIDVNDFVFSEEFIDIGKYTNESLAPFTTAIGMGWAISKHDKKHLPDISFVPKYVFDRQKIFKLHWHGFLLLFLIMTSFPILDFFRQRGNANINTLNNAVSLLDMQIRSFDYTLNNYNRISAELSQIQNKLELMNTLAENSITWSTNLDLINSGIEEIGSVWLTSISIGKLPNTLEIQGIARDRDKIPLVAEIFANATLLNVSSSEIRGEEVFNFSYSIGKIVANTSVYTPTNLKGLEELTGN